MNEHSPIRVLHLEDSEFYARIVADLLGEAMPTQIHRVQTRTDFVDALETDRFDVILSDHTMVGFDGLSALAIARDKAAEVPFIFVSGTIGEERAVASLKQGATDYVLKDRLEHLVPAVQRSVRESRDERQRRTEEVETLTELLREQEAGRLAAEDANRGKDDFLAILGHELRHPLAPILNALDLMRVRGLNTFQPERAVIERQVRHLVRLVDDLCDVARAGSSRLPIRKTAVDLATVVERALETASPLCAEKRHRLHIHVAPGIQVRGDEDRLVQIVVNLVINAAKFTPEPGSITVEGRAERDHAVLRVRDNGIGISPSLLPHVFDRFVRGSKSRGTADEGLGLGLAIARSLVEAHGGTIRAASDGLGMGTELTVTLPLFHALSLGAPMVAAPKQEASALRPRQPEYLQEIPPVRILIVDDSKDTAETLAAALAQEGHIVRFALDGETALRVAAELRPEIALLDLGMPRMSGFELAAALREPSKTMQAPVLIALSGYGMSSDRQRTAAAGFSDHLVKPVDLEELLQVIDAVSQPLSSA